MRTSSDTGSQKPPHAEENSVVSAIAAHQAAAFSLVSKHHHDQGIHPSLDQRNWQRETNPLLSEQRVSRINRYQRKFLSQNSEKSIFAVVRSHQKWGCVSQDVELPETKVGLTNENRSILEKYGERCPRAHLGLKFSKIAERCVRIREPLGPSVGVIQGKVKNRRNPKCAYV